MEGVIQQDFCIQYKPRLGRLNCQNAVTLVDRTSICWDPALLVRPFKLSLACLECNLLEAKAMITLSSLGVLLSRFGRHLLF